MVSKCFGSRNETYPTHFTCTPSNAMVCHTVWSFYNLGGAVVEVLRASPKHMVCLNLVCLNLTTWFDSLRIADRDCERRGLIHTPRQVVVYIELINCGGVQYPDKKLNGLHNLPRNTIGHVCPRIRECSRLHELVYIHCVGIRRVVASWLTGRSGIALSGPFEHVGGGSVNNLSWGPNQERSCGSVLGSSSKPSNRLYPLIAVKFFRPGWIRSETFCGGG